jgi:hypothetical protein
MFDCRVTILRLSDTKPFQTTGAQNRINRENFAHVPQRAARQVSF